MRTIGASENNQDLMTVRSIIVTLLTVLVKWMRQESRVSNRIDT